jgi:hypothetical protein
MLLILIGKLFEWIPKLIVMVKEWIPKVIMTIKMNPNVWSNFSIKRLYFGSIPKLSKMIADKTPSYNSQKERRRGGTKAMWIGIGLIAVAIVLSLLIGD